MISRPPKYASLPRVVGADRLSRSFRALPYCARTSGHLVAVRNIDLRKGCPASVERAVGPCHRRCLARVGIGWCRNIHMLTRPRKPVEHRDESGARLRNPR
jgi:hypothetical protein